MIEQWSEYLEALRRCCVAVKLVAYHTNECARATEETATQASLTSFYIKEYLDEQTTIPFE